MKGFLINSVYSKFIIFQILYAINLTINMAELKTMDQGSITYVLYTSVVVLI